MCPHASFFSIPLGGFEEQASESSPNATATDTGTKEAGKGNVSPHQVFGYLVFFQLWKNTRDIRLTIFKYSL